MTAITYFADSIRGMREKNEDAFFAGNIGDSYLFVVADGLGGHPAGEVASALAVSAFSAPPDEPVQDAKGFLLERLADAHIDILRKGEENPAWKSMGTTLIAAFIHPDGTGLLLNVGDSRGHMINGGITHTNDQNMAQELVRAGELTAEEAMNHPLSSVVSQALGKPDIPYPEFYGLDIRDKYLLLSSDGLHDFVPEEVIMETVAVHGASLAGTVDALFEIALQNGSSDNITIVLAKG